MLIIKINSNDYWQYPSNYKSDVYVSFQEFIDPSFDLSC